MNLIDKFIERLGLLGDNLAVPGDIVEVFKFFPQLWEAIPFLLRSALLACFVVACLLAIAKMLF